MFLDVMYDAAHISCCFLMFLGVMLDEGYVSFHNAAHVSCCNAQHMSSLAVMLNASQFSCCNA